MHLTRTCKDLVRELSAPMEFSSEELEDLVRSALAYFDYELFLPCDIARLLLVPALEHAVRGEMDDEVQQILDDRYRAVMGNTPLPAE